MSKESKNLGVTIPCPECKKTLIKYSDVEGNGKFDMKCPHCDAIIRVVFKQKTTMKTTKVLDYVLVAIFVLMVGLLAYNMVYNSHPVVTNIPYADPQ